MKAAIERALSEHGHGWVVSSSPTRDGCFVVGPDGQPPALVVNAKADVWVIGKESPAALRVRSLLVQAIADRGPRAEP